MRPYWAEDRTTGHADKRPAADGLRILGRSGLFANDAIVVSGSNRIAVPLSRAVERITVANGVAYRSKWSGLQRRGVSALLS
jgi:hypothetical protein